MTTPLTRIYEYLKDQLRYNESMKRVYRSVFKAGEYQQQTIVVEQQSLVELYLPEYAKISLYKSDTIRILDILGLIDIEYMGTSSSISINQEFITLAEHAEDELEDFIQHRYFSFYREFMLAVKKYIKQQLMSVDSINTSDIIVLLDYRNQIQIGYGDTIDMQDIFNNISGIVKAGDGNLTINQRKVVSDGSDLDVETCQHDIESRFSVNTDYTLVTIGFTYSKSLDDFIKGGK